MELEGFLDGLIIQSSLITDTYLINVIIVFKIKLGKITSSINLNIPETTGGRENDLVSSLTSGTGCLTCQGIGGGFLDVSEYEYFLLNAAIIQIRPA